MNSFSAASSPATEVKGEEQRAGPPSDAGVPGLQSCSRAFARDCSRQNQAADLYDCILLPCPNAIVQEAVATFK